MLQLKTKDDIGAFLEEHGYKVSVQEEGVLVLEDEDGLNIFAAADETQLEFMVNLCSVNDLDTSRLAEIYERILDQNTEILPSCFGIDSDDPSDKRIVLVDSIATANLDENELLLSLDALTVNVVTAHDLLQPYFKK